MWLCISTKQHKLLKRDMYFFFRYMKKYFFFHWNFWSHVHFYNLIVQWRISCHFFKFLLAIWKNSYLRLISALLVLYHKIFSISGQRTLRILKLFFSSYTHTRLSENLLHIADADGKICMWNFVPRSLNLGETWDFRKMPKEINWSRIPI